MKTMVITGASDGIGAEMARQLAQRHSAQSGSAAGRGGAMRGDGRRHAGGPHRRVRTTPMHRADGSGLKLLAPGAVENMALAALKDEVPPQ